ncbi:hypothetical protein FA13DRAFT_1643166, partial [Coprinellus micaceus]
TTHTYLDGIGPFTNRGVWACDALHSTATLSIQSAALACMGVYPPCTVLIFSFPRGHSG